MLPLLSIEPSMTNANRGISIPNSYTLVSGQMT